MKGQEHQTKDLAMTYDSTEKEATRKSCPLSRRVMIVFKTEAPPSKALVAETSLSHTERERHTHIRNARSPNEIIWVHDTKQEWGDEFD